MKQYFKILFISIVFACVNVPYSYSVDGAHEQTSLEKIQEYFKNLKTLNAEFIQTDGTSNIRKGRLIISKPQQMKIDYFSPEEEILIMDGDSLVHYNKELSEVSYANSDKLPLSILTNEDFNFENDVEIQDISEIEESIITDFIISHDEENDYYIQMTFKKNPLSLSSIRVNSGGDEEIIMNLLDSKLNQRVDPKEFEFRNPNYFND